MTNVKEKILTRSETAAVLKEYFDYIQKFLPPLDDIKWYKGVEVALEYLQGLTAADIPFEESVKKIIMKQLRRCFIIVVSVPVMSKVVGVK